MADKIQLREATRCTDLSCSLAPATADTENASHAARHRSTRHGQDGTPCHTASNAGHTGAMGEAGAEDGAGTGEGGAEVEAPCSAPGTVRCDPTTRAPGE